MKPETIAARAEKKVYPPVQWWPLRVANPSVKVAFVVVLLVAWRAATWFAPLAIPAIAVEVASDVLWPVAVIALARSFRGEGEPFQPPRPWWRLTVQSRIGWFIGGYYALLEIIGLIVPVRVDRYVAVAVSVVCGLFLAAAFLNSSIRLTIARRRSQ